MLNRAEDIGSAVLLQRSRYFVSPPIADLIAIVGIWVYVVLVGADTAVLRKAIVLILPIVLVHLRTLDQLRRIMDIVKSSAVSSPFSAA